MKKNLLRFLREIPRGFFYPRLIVFLFAFFLSSFCSQGQTVQTFTYTGSLQSFTVPSCVNALSVNVSGAKGGDGLNNSAGSGALGGNIAAVISVTPGQVLNLYVGGMGGNATSGFGGAGGYNGGGAGAANASFYSGGGGGGASDIRVSPYSLSDRVLVAGGGGGGGTYTNTSAGFERGGSGGTATGENGFSSNSNVNGAGGGGGNNSSGGAAGTMTSFCTAQSGSQGLGGAANTCSNGGGGGGGGYYGGGGGISAGGGGGSSYAVLSSSTVVHSLGSNPGNGFITIAYKQITPTINIASTSTVGCAGTPFTFTASGGVNYTWTTVPASQTITGQSIVTHTFFTQGGYAVNVVGSSNISGCTSSTTMVMIVNAAPLMGTGATKTVICSGSSTTLYVTGANLYEWSPNANSATTSTTVVSPTTATVYYVNGTLSATGCTATASVTIHVYKPLISVLGDTSICSGKSSTLTANIINPASGGINSYTWTGPGFPASPGPSITVSPLVPTVYTISAKSVTNVNVICVVSKTVSMLVHNNPTITVSSNPIFICRNEPFTLSAQGAATYTWNNGTFTGATIPTVQPMVGTFIYTVVGTNSNGCKGDTVFYVKIIPCGGIEEFDQNSTSFSVYPNPNNGVFNVIGNHDMTLRLTNQLGEIIREFKLKAYNEHNVSVADLARGVYFISSSNNQAVTRQKIIVR